MDRLHEMLRAIRPETKASDRFKDQASDHLTVFREFLAHLDQLQRQPEPPQVKPVPRKARAPRAKA